MPFDITILATVEVNLFRSYRNEAAVPYLFQTIYNNTVLQNFMGKITRSVGTTLSHIAQGTPIHCGLNLRHKGAIFIIVRKAFAGGGTDVGGASLSSNPRVTCIVESAGHIA